MSDRTCLVLVSLFLLVFQAEEVCAQGKYLNWSQKNTLPVQEPGHSDKWISAPFMGVHNEVLIVAGGFLHGDSAEAPGTIPLRSRTIFIGKKGEEGKYEWEHNPQRDLDVPLSAGISITTPEGVMCVGGMDKWEGGSLVRLLRWEPEVLGTRITGIPSLPFSSAGCAGAAIGSVVYIAGGGEAKQFCRMDLSIPEVERSWEMLPSWPGPARSGMSAGVQGNGYTSTFYLFGGKQVGAENEFLHDGYAFDPATSTWKSLSPLEVKGVPYVIHDVATVPAGVHHLLVLGGKPEGAPGNFALEILAFHTITQTWTVVDTAPAGFVSATPAAWIGGSIAIPGERNRAGTPGALWEVSPNPAPSGLRWLDYVVIVLYLIILVGMGAYFTRKGKTTEDYFKAGKRIPWWAAGISIFATSLSAITYMAVPAKAYSTDWLFFFLSMSQILTVPLVIWLVLPFFRRLNVTTAYEYLEQRFHVLIRLIGGLAFLFFQFGRIGIVLFLPAIALSVVTGVDIYLCILAMGVLSIFYTVLGGIEAVIWTDVKQVVVLTVGAIVCLCMMASGVEGGFDTLVDIGASDGKLRLLNLDLNLNNPTIWVVLGGGIGTNLINQTSDQTFVQRYLTTKDEKSAARSLLTPAFLVLPVSLLFFGLGTALYGFYKTHPEALNPVLENADAIFPWYIISQLPQGVSGLLIAGIFAASMSSLDSSLNSAATVVTVDFYKRFFPKGKDQHYLKVARIVTVVAGVVGMGFALLMAGFEIKSLWDEFSKILGLFAGGLAGLFLLGMSSKRATTGGALIGFVVSAGVQYWVSSSGSVHFLLYTLTGVASCYAVGWAASWLFPKRENLQGLTIGTIREISEKD